MVKAIGLKLISLWERRFEPYQLWKFYFSPNVPTYRGKWLDFRNQITMYSLSICKSSCGRVVKAISSKSISLWERRFELYQLRKFYFLPNVPTHRGKWLDFRNQNAMYSLSICKSSCGRVVKAIGLKPISLWECRFEPYQLRKFYFSPNVPTYRGKWLDFRNQITMYSIGICKTVVAEWLRRLARNQFPSGSVGSNPTNCGSNFSLNVPTHRGKFGLSQSKCNLFNWHM